MIEITYVSEQISVYRHVIGQGIPFYVKAIGKFEGQTLYFGGYEKSSCDYCIDGEVLIKCFEPDARLTRGKPTEEAVAVLCEKFLETLRKSVAGDLLLTRSLWKTFTYKKQPVNFIPAWKINLLMD